MNEEQNRWLFSFPMETPEEQVEQEQHADVAQMESLTSPTTEQSEGLTAGEFSALSEGSDFGAEDGMDGGLDAADCDGGCDGGCGM